MINLWLYYYNILFIILNIPVIWLTFLVLIPNRLKLILQLISLFFSCLLFLCSLLLWIYFDASSALFQFIVVIPFFIDYNINIIFGIDGLSLLFICLTTLLFPFCILSSWELSKFKFLIMHLIIIELLLLLTFSVLDLFLFTLFFESLLIPIFIIILNWGTRQRRIKALLYFFIYTLFGSIFLIVALFILYFETQTTNLLILLSLTIDVDKQLLIYFLFFIAFAIKIPIIPFHIWLPEAHVEAPTVGSVILAGLLLKLGGYGMIRFLFLFDYARFFFQPLFIILFIISILFSSFIALRQIDIKRIVAYSSIAHINFALLGYFSNSIYGFIGGIILIISHGIISSALFLSVGVLYDRYHSRLLYYYSGLVQLIPLFVAIFFLFVLSNISLPLTSNFIGELLILISLSTTNQIVTLSIAVISTFFIVAYIFFFFSRISFGEIKIIFIYIFVDIFRREYLYFLPLILLNLFIGLIPISVLVICYTTLKDILYLKLSYYHYHGTYLAYNWEPFFYETEKVLTYYINSPSHIVIDYHLFARAEKIEFLKQINQINLTTPLWLNLLPDSANYQIRHILQLDNIEITGFISLYNNYYDTDIKYYVSEVDYWELIIDIFNLINKAPHPDLIRVISHELNSKCRELIFYNGESAYQKIKCIVSEDAYSEILIHYYYSYLLDKILLSKYKI